jgi:sugar phosphate isomerase/epimerase
MNHPREPVADEIRWMAAMGLDFLDLTLEPPAAAPDRVDIREIRSVLADHGMSVIGHTAYYLPFSSPFPKVRQAAVDELRRCVELFAEVGAKWMNVHPDRYAPMHDRAFFVAGDVEGLAPLIETGREVGVGVMVENIPGDFNHAWELRELLDPLPELGLHLDIGHCNLHVHENTAPELLDAFGARLRHVHLHDNKGGTADLHLPLGAGTMDWRRHVRALKACGYDGTITLEVFTPDRRHLAYSRDVLREAWEEGD